MNIAHFKGANLLEQLARWGADMMLSGYSIEITGYYEPLQGGLCVLYASTT